MAWLRFCLNIISNIKGIAEKDYSAKVEDVNVEDLVELEYVLIDLS